MKSAAREVRDEEMEYYDDFELERAANRILKQCEKHGECMNLFVSFNLERIVDVQNVDPVDHEVVRARQPTPRRQRRTPRNAQRQHISIRNNTVLSKTQKRILSCTLVSGSSPKHSSKCVLRSCVS